MSSPSDRSSPLVFILALCAVALIVLLVHNPLAHKAPFSAPTWWVALKAPQYPDTAFPDGIRIHFHVDGVFNGCKKVESKEKDEEDALDCKHEMDAINHYVGMYPIAAGAPIERAFGPFIFTLLSLMIVAFAIPGRGRRAAFLAVGCLGIAIWMGMAMYTKGGVQLLTDSYLADITKTMDLDASQLKEWSGFAAIGESYTEALGRYFRETAVIAHRVAVMETVAHATFYLLLAAMVVLVVGVWKLRPFSWLLVLVPMLLPLFFIIDYAGWLWWFGHNLNEMGAFTVKPFMPTVFGQGKVAQFSTHSYPYWGFGVMVAISAVLAAAALIRRGQWRATGGP